MLRSSRGCLAALMPMMVAGLGACQVPLRVRGSEAREARPALTVLQREVEEYRVWVIVPWLKVNAYPQWGKSQQPMLQFSGDLDRLERGWGSVAMVGAPDEFTDGQEVTFFEDRVLWSDRLRANDSRVFALWLRENNRSAPTRFDERMTQVDRVAEVVEEVSGLTGFRIPARRAMNLSVQAFKELQQDWLILKWVCPWRHVLASARPGLAPNAKRAMVLEARIASSEEVHGQPVAEAKILFVVQLIETPLPPHVR